MTFANTAAVKTYLEESQIENVKLAVIDIDGVLRGKYVNTNKFLSALDKGFGFCNVIFGWDVDDSLYAEESFTGWQSGYDDAIAGIDMSSCRKLPTENNKSVLFLADFSTQEAAKVCPRSVLKKVLSKAEGLGYQATAAFEFEFFLFNETPQSIQEKGFSNLNPDRKSVV